jgi:hypothetical protein
MQEKYKLIYELNKGKIHNRYYGISLNKSDPYTFDIIPCTNDDMKHMIKQYLKALRNDIVELENNLIQLTNIDFYKNKILQHKIVDKFLSTILAEQYKKSYEELDEMKTRYDLTVLLFYSSTDSLETARTLAILQQD